MPDWLAFVLMIVIGLVLLYLFIKNDPPNGPYGY